VMYVFCATNNLAHLYNVSLYYMQYRNALTYVVAQGTRAAFLRTVMWTSVKKLDKS
jgi:hypothetical protein